MSPRTMTPEQRIADLERKLAAREAELVEAREAVRVRFQAYSPGDSSCGSGSKLSEHMQGLCACEELMEWFLATLSRPVGSLYALEAFGVKVALKVEQDVDLNPAHWMAGETARATKIVRDIMAGGAK